MSLISGVAARSTDTFHRSPQLAGESK